MQKNFQKDSETEQDAQQLQTIDPTKWTDDTFLRNEGRFRNQPMEIRRASPEQPMTLGFIIRELLDIPASDIGSMTVVRRGDFPADNTTEFIESPAEVLEFQPMETLIAYDREGIGRARTALHTVLTIAYRPSRQVFAEMSEKSDKSTNLLDGNIIVHLQPIGPFAKDTVHARMSVMIPNFCTIDEYRNADDPTMPFVRSFILAYDLTSPEERLKRIEELEKSILKKAETGEELTHEEGVLLEGIRLPQDIMRETQHALTLIDADRYADALRHLFVVYGHFKSAPLQAIGENSRFLTEICYNIGICFQELGQYDRSIYFLDMTTDVEDQRYEAARLKSMILNKDPRAMECVVLAIKEFKEGKWKTGTPHDLIFMELLYQTEATILIDHQEWADARQLLTGMKERSTLSKRFAEQKLEEINRLTEESGQD